MNRPALLRRHVRVFISSSYEDLKEHRKVVHNTLERMELPPIDMVDFGARVGTASVESVKAVASCDLYIGIVAWRYGSIPDNDTRSYTHQEYDEAIQQRKPCLIFLSDPKTEQQDRLDDLFPAATRNPDHEKLLLRFRDAVKTQLVDYFTTPNDLGRKVATALHRYMMTLPLSFASDMPRALPPRTVDFIGREGEVKQVETALREEQNRGRSASIVGMGGMGKSSLAAEVMAQIATNHGAFTGGITWLRCDERKGQAGQVWVYDQILMCWQQALTPQELAQLKTLEAQVTLRELALRTRLRLPGAALVLLDNVEPELPLKPILDLLSTIPITLLVTSRHVTLSPRLQQLSLSGLLPTPAVALFKKHFQAKGGIWDANLNDAATLKVVDALGYLPLAIELAASRAALLKKPIGEMADELQTPNVLSLLRDPIDSSASVRYVLQKSLDGLEPAQFACFAALGLPTGADWPYPVILSLLGAVLFLYPGHGFDAEGNLYLLIALSLVTLTNAEGDGGSGSVRVRMHPLLRALAQEEWQKQDAAAQIAGMNGLLEGLLVYTADHKHAHKLLQREEDLLVQSIHHASAMNTAPQQIKDLVGALTDYFENEGHWQVEYELRKLQLIAQRALSNRRGEAHSLNDLGIGANLLGLKSEADQHFKQALQICRDLGEREDEGAILNNMGDYARSVRRIAEADTYYQQALAIRREVGDKQGEGSTLYNLGELAYLLGNKEEAAKNYQQALEISQATDYRILEGFVFNNLGKLAFSLERIEEASQFYQQALEVSKELSARDLEGQVLNNLGKLAFFLNKPDEASQLYQQAVQILQQVGDRRFEGETRHNLGELADSLGEKEKAAQYYQQALLLFEMMGMQQEAQIERDILGVLIGQQNPE